MAAQATVQKLKIYPTVEIELGEPQVQTPYQQLQQSEQQNGIDFEEWKVGGLQFRMCELDT